jgi:hypothetical protein
VDFPVDGGTRVSLVRESREDQHHPVDLGLSSAAKLPTMSLRLLEKRVVGTRKSKPGVNGRAAGLSKGAGTSASCARKNFAWTVDGIPKDRQV